MSRVAALLLPATLIFSGCTCKQEIRTEFVDRPVKVKVPVPCRVQETKCYDMADMNDSEVVIELVRCIEAHREAERVCQ
ncbi:hypothetical protein ACM66T_10300 [Sulfurimonas sp. ST-25]|uniref:hypothetical protein n=1 Tax=Sulfurimonas sp. ST-25 TaxID=3400151 RepID=UPI003A8B045F